MNKTVFIAGAGGYIGTTMVEFFLRKKWKVIALDRFFFGDTLEHLRSQKRLAIVKDDVRTFHKLLLRKVDIVINLAAISNDPASELNPEITRSINYLGAVRLAKLAKEMKVRRYILSSSCSVYGAGSGIVDETSKTHPLSEYARTKLLAERDILKLADTTFTVTILRLATIFGPSIQRMRFDLVINLMTLHAWKYNRIRIMDGGKQWRPIIHVLDAIQMFYLVATEKNTKKIQKQIINIGANTLNFQVFQIANIFLKKFSKLKIEEIPDDPDQRSYRVNFNKVVSLFRFKPTHSISSAIDEITNHLKHGTIQDTIKTSTMQYYQYLMETDKLLEL